MEPSPGELQQATAPWVLEGSVAAQHGSSWLLARAHSNMRSLSQEGGREAGSDRRQAPASILPASLWIAVPAIEKFAACNYITSPLKQPVWVAPGRHPPSTYLQKVCLPSSHSPLVTKMVSPQQYAPTLVHRHCHHSPVRAKCLFARLLPKAHIYAFANFISQFFLGRCVAWNTKND